ncbi:hypothetical protein IF188_06415 [Microbacterium sp. NEAU-LLC]|uniref:Uncharacterized protein n=1 Tax=Microbacterium helvum TaxID=2773713 RepID=A0ABR8NNI1_9MICO|nr:hypothetical protein [Microbacterium helvum]MBD3941332.1 hypothetical protein [Microbacterium helvum]
MTVGSEAEADTLLADCLHARGWDVTVSSDGGVEAEFANEQLDRYLADQEICSSGISHREWTDADYSTTYDGLLASLSCLQARGYPTPDATPSLQRFVEQRRSPDDAIWDPYSQVPPSSLAEALSLCPEPDPIY